MLGVMAWRNGWGKPSKLSPESSNGTSALIIDIFDKKNRRMITDRDIHYFIEENFYSKLYFRVLSATILSLGIAVAVALPYFRDDTVATFVSWVLVLATPIFALIWILASWTYWNRRYLLRYGCIVEGKWLNCAKPNQSISYIPEAGKSFELTRNQWHRADYVPIVIFDPSRPNFAIQYTGESEHALLALNLESTVKEPPKNACSFDVFRLAAVLAVLVGGAVATQLLFHAAYPASLSEWRLQELSQAYAIVSDDKNDSAQVPCSEEQNADQPQSNCNATQIDKDERRPIVKTPGTTFTMACLELCRDGDDMCQRQCHTRQLFNILKDAGYDFDGTISITPNSSINADKLLPKRATSSSIRLSLAPNAHSAFQTHLCGTTISTSISSAFIAITTPSSPRNSAISLRKSSPIQKSSRNYATMLVSKIRAIASNLLLAPMALKNSNQLSAHSIPPSETIHSHNPYYLRPPLRADYVQTAARRCVRTMSKPPPATRAGHVKNAARHACRPCQKRRPPPRADLVNRMDCW